MTVSTDNLAPRGVVAGGTRLGYALVALGGLVLFCYGLYLAAWLVNTLVMTLLLALVVSPILFRLKRRGWPEWAAVLGAFLVVFGITLAFVALALVSLSRLDDNLPFYQQRADRDRRPTSPTASGSRIHRCTTSRRSRADFAQRIRSSTWSRSPSTSSACSARSSCTCSCCSTRSAKCS